MNPEYDSLVWNGKRVHTWGQFDRVVKTPERKLLARLEAFPDAALVAGCQRSGTTALSRVFAQAEGVADHRFGRDDELDAALLLSGQVEMPLRGRACLQTTYLNDRYTEYFEHDGFRLVWMLREPSSVVFSMLHNWRRGALQRLFDACGREYAPPAVGSSRWFGPSRFEQACASYVAKTAQTFELVERLGSRRVLVVDYDDLVLNKNTLLPMIFDFAGLPWSDRLLDLLHRRSVRRGNRLPPRQAEQVDAFCRPIYERARALLSASAA